MTPDSHLQAVEDLLLSVSESAVPLLRDTSQHILSAGGKRLRPRLLLAAYAAAGGSDLELVVPLAAAVEIIHTATLVHDDINDQGTMRRGRETINARWGRTYALLTGDFLFTKTYQIMAPFSRELNTILARASTELVEGETLQMVASRQGTLDRETYFQIIAKKTASLFVAAMELGGVAAEAPAEWIEALRLYGFNVGLAFQITDDVLDLVADAQQLGKNAGMDMAQGRGIAVAMQGGGSDGRAQAAVSMEMAVEVEALKQRALEGYSLEAAIEKGRDKAHELAAFATASLDILPASAARDELHALARQVVERDH